MQFFSEIYLDRARLLIWSKTHKLKKEMQNTVLFIAIHSESFTFADKRHTELASYKLSNYEIIVFI